MKIFYDILKFILAAWYKHDKVCDGCILVYYFRLITMYNLQPVLNLACFTLSLYTLSCLNPSLEPNKLYAYMNVLVT